MRPSTPLVATLLVSITAFAPSLRAQATPAADSSASSYTASDVVLAVEVPVQVTVGSTPVRDLRAEQFEVWDGETKQALTGFEVVDLLETDAIPTGSEAALPAAGRRHLLFLFDLAFSQPPAVLKAKAAALEAARTSLHPSDLAAVATYSVSDGVRIVLGFSSDRTYLRTAIEGVGSPQFFTRSADPLRLTLAEIQADVLARSQVPPPAGSGGAADALAEGKAERRAEILQESVDVAEVMAQSSERVERSQQAEQVRDFARSWTSLSRMLASVKGRKYVLFLSEGFDASVLAGTQPGRHARDSAEVGEIWQVDSDARYGSNRAQNELQKLLEELRRADCVVHTVDIGGARTSADAQADAMRVGGQGLDGVAATSGAGGADRGQDSLFLLAHDTGGDLVRNFNDLGHALDKVLARTSVTYILTFQPQDPRADGAYHQLQVKLRGAPRGARVSHRSGYYAPRHFADRSAAERDFAAAQLLMTGGEAGAMEAAVLAVPLPSAGGGRAEVAVVIDVPGKPLLAGHWGEDVPTQIYVYALSAEGGIGDHLAQRLNLDLSKVGGVLEQGGVRFLGKLDLAPGRYDLRTLVRNERSGAYALRSSPLVVPAFGAAPVLSVPTMPAFGGAFIPARSPRWSTPPPFTLDARPFLPSPLAIFRSGQASRLWMPSLNLPAGVLGAEFRLLAEDGSVTATMPMEVERRAPHDDFEPLLLKMAALAAAVAQGSYRFEIELRTPDGRLVRSAPVPAYVLQSS